MSTNAGFPDSSVVEHLAYNARGREFESRLGQLFSRTFTFHQCRFYVPSPMATIKQNILCS